METILKSTYNISAGSNYRGSNLMTQKLSDCALIEAYVIKRLNVVSIVFICILFITVSKLYYCFLTLNVL